MTSLLSQFNTASSAVTQTPREKSGETRSKKSQLLYAKHFGADGNTVAKVSAALEISHVGCLNQVFRYEKRGLMRRKTERDPATGALIFYWIGEIA